MNFKQPTVIIPPDSPLWLESVVRQINEGFKEIHRFLKEIEGDTVTTKTSKPRWVVVASTATVENAEVAHDVNATFSDTEVEAALNALGSKINEIIDQLGL